MKELDSRFHGNDIGDGNDIMKGNVKIEGFSMIDKIEGFSMIDKIEGFSMIDKIEKLDSRLHGNDKKCYSCRRKNLY